MAVSLNKRSGNINIVLQLQTHAPSACLNTTEIEQNIHATNACINKVPINLTRMLSDNLNICAINKYANMLGDGNHIQ